MCVVHAILGGGFSSTSQSVFVSRRASDTGPTLCGKCAIMKTDLRYSFATVGDPRFVEIYIGSSDQARWIDFKLFHERR